MKIDIFFGALVVFIATIGMGLLGYILSEESVSMGVLAAAVTVVLLLLGVLCASKEILLPAFGVVSAIVFVWAVYVIATRGHSWTAYFLAFNAEAAFFTGGRVYAEILAKWRSRPGSGQPLVR
jgi:hypothetical protein